MNKSKLTAQVGGVHAPHTILPGYHPDQVWYDGCPTCEARGELLAIEKLDAYNFAKAWDRGAQLLAEGLPNASAAELPLLRLLGTIGQMYNTSAGMILNPVDAR